MATYIIRGAGSLPLDAGTVRVLVTLLNPGVGFQFGSHLPTETGGYGVVTVEGPGGYSAQCPLVQATTQIDCPPGSNVLDYQIWRDAEVQVSEVFSLAPDLSGDVTIGGTLTIGGPQGQTFSKTDNQTRVSGSLYTQLSFWANTDLGCGGNFYAGGTSSFEVVSVGGKFEQFNGAGLTMSGPFAVTAPETSNTLSTASNTRDWMVTIGGTRYRIRLYQ